ncbi:hypothetical protein BKA56DRAFT_569198 [Ilyonectria sp. MPI-CAGE-AT-0026]|nr:hypothetical protein BKA56DRAFT_569198 [Ilyonectria sp. MPI-CAGE-AT-0026]
MIFGSVLGWGFAGGVAVRPSGAGVGDKDVTSWNCVVDSSWKCAVVSSWNCADSSWNRVVPSSFTRDCDCG